MKKIFTILLLTILSMTVYGNDLSFELLQFENEALKTALERETILKDQYFSNWILSEQNNSVLAGVNNLLEEEKATFMQITVLAKQTITDKNTIIDDLKSKAMTSKDIQTALEIANYNQAEKLDTYKDIFDVATDNAYSPTATAGYGGDTSMSILLGMTLIFWIAVLVIGKTISYFRKLQPVKEVTKNNKAKNNKAKATKTSTLKDDLKKTAKIKGLKKGDIIIDKDHLQKKSTAFSLLLKPLFKACMEVTANNNKTPNKSNKSTPKNNKSNKNNKNNKKGGNK